jgi:hypothetical protein
MGSEQKHNWRNIPVQDGEIVALAVLVIMLRLLSAPTVLLHDKNVELRKTGTKNEGLGSAVLIGRWPGTS